MYFHHVVVLNLEERKEEKKCNIAYVIMCCVHLFVYNVLYGFTWCVKPYKCAFFCVVYIHMDVNENYALIFETYVLFIYSCTYLTCISKLYTTKKWQFIYNWTFSQWKHLVLIYPYLTSVEKKYHHLRTYQKIYTHITNVVQVYQRCAYIYIDISSSNGKKTLMHLSIK